MRELHRITEKTVVTDNRTIDLRPPDRQVSSYQAPNQRAEWSPAQRVIEQTWRRVLSGLVTLTTLTVAIALGVLYLLVSKGV